MQSYSHTLSLDSLESEVLSYVDFESNQKLYLRNEPVFILTPSIALKFAGGNSGNLQN